MNLNAAKILDLEKRIAKVEGSEIILKTWLYDEYVSKNLSTHQISLKLSKRPYNQNISDTCIANYLHHFNIPLRKGFHRSKN